MKTIIKNAKVIAPHEVIDGSSVVIEEGKIVDVLDSTSKLSKKDHSVIDAQGKYLSPGFIDIHNHGNSGYDFMDSTFEAIEKIAEFHLKNGVTGFLATTITASKEETINALKNVKDYINNVQKDKAKIQSELLGVYLEGPYFSQKKKGAQPLKHIKNPDVNELKELVTISGNSIKVVALAPELQGASKVLGYLEKQGIAPFAGHTDGSFEEIKKAIFHGLVGTTHLFNGMRGFSHREPGAVGAVLIDERVMCELICDGIHVHPGAMELAYKLKGKEGLILVSDAMMAAGLPEGEYQLGGQKVFVKGKAARLENDSLAGSTLTLNKAVYNMINMVGIPVCEAVRMATLNPAQMIGVSRDKGSIEAGKDADLIIFDDEINVTDVIIGGITRRY
ncbi:N-acetylglucosamine-6-phosphate deacetylase [Proteinivorax tanatarense]|uniref:N-acetylglucosamine-6-phosphate deacetylase n=1 Tax=Proteinivorax tanatarense TaxID=1260629 RepID=A0AAU7VMP0_9FIRM